jgi:hypothetical protein
MASRCPRKAVAIAVANAAAIAVAATTITIAAAIVIVVVVINVAAVIVAVSIVVIVTGARESSKGCKSAGAFFIARISQNKISNFARPSHAGFKTSS